MPREFSSFTMHVLIPDSQVCECNGVLDPVIGTTGSLCMSVLKVDPQSTATSLVGAPICPHR